MLGGMERFDDLERRIKGLEDHIERNMGIRLDPIEQEFKDSLEELKKQMVGVKEQMDRVETKMGRIESKMRNLLQEGEGGDTEHGDDR